MNAQKYLTICLLTVVFITAPGCRFASVLRGGAKKPKVDDQESLSSSLVIEVNGGVMVDDELRLDSSGLFHVKSTKEGVVFDVGQLNDHELKSNIVMLAEGVTEWQQNFLPSKEAETRLRLRISAYQRGRNERVIIHKTLILMPKKDGPSDEDLPVALAAAEMEPVVYVNNEAYVEGRAYDSAVQLSIEPKENVLYKLAMKEHRQTIFTELTAPGGISQVDMMGLGSIFGPEVNRVTLELTVFQSNLPTNAFVKTYYYYLTPNAFSPQLQINGKALLSGSYFSGPVKLTLVREAQTSYSLDVKANQAIFTGGSQELHLEDKDADQLELFPGDQQEVTYHVHLAAAKNLPGDGKTFAVASAKDYTIKVSPSNLAIADFAILVNGISSPHDFLHHIDLEPKQHAEIEVQAVADLVYHVKVYRNNEKTSYVSETTPHYSAKFSAVGDAVTKYRIDVRAVNSAGSVAQKTVKLSLTPVDQYHLTQKLAILRQAHKKRLRQVDQIANIKLILDAEFNKDTATKKQALLQANENAEIHDSMCTYITPEQRNALKIYKGSGFKKINNFLRFGEAPIFGLGCLITSDPLADVKHCVVLLDEIFTTVANSPHLALTEDLIVYRGGYLDPKLVPTSHTVVAEAAYMSTSLKARIAQEFYMYEASAFSWQLQFPGPYVAPSAAMYRIKIPAGTRVLFLENLCGGLLSHEDEILLPRASKLKARAEIMGTPEFYEYIDDFNTSTECELCSPPYQVYRSMDFLLVKPSLP